MKVLESPIEVQSIYHKLRDLWLHVQIFILTFQLGIIKTIVELFKMCSDSDLRSLKVILQRTKGTDHDKKQ